MAVYVARKEDLVAAAAARLSAPDHRVEFGSTPDHVMIAVFKGLILGFLLRKLLERQ